MDRFMFDKRWYPNMDNTSTLNEEITTSFNVGI